MGRFSSTTTFGLLDWAPRFAKRYAELNGEIADALSRYAADVRSGIGSEPAVSRP
jgi:ketopantoate hydroxymethyltransferase